MGHLANHNKNCFLFNQDKQDRVDNDNVVFAFGTDFDWVVYNLYSVPLMQQV